MANQSDTFGTKRKEIKDSGKLFAEEINNSFFITCSAKSEDNIDNLEDYILKNAKDIIDEEEKEDISKNQNSRESKKSVKIIKKNVNVKTKKECC